MDEPEIVMVRSAEEFAEALHVRIAVFVHEQGGPLEDEPDEQDHAATHLILRARGETVGTARLYEEAPGVARIGRVALLPEHRGRGWGALLMRAALDQCRERGCVEAALHAQAHACLFYKRLGFQSVGELFMEAGIPHCLMRIQLGAPLAPSFSPHHD